MTNAYALGTGNSRGDSKLVVSAIVRLSGGRTGRWGFGEAFRPVLEESGAESTCGRALRMGLLVNGGGDDLDATPDRLHGCCAIPEDERAWGVGRGPVPGAELEQHAALVSGTPETLLVDVVGKC